MATFIVSGKERELTYMVNGIDISNDFIGNTAHGMSHDGEGNYIASEDDFKWWEDVILNHQGMSAKIAEYKENNDPDEVDQVVNDWAGNDYETHPSQVLMGLEKAFDLINEVRTLITTPEVKDGTYLTDWIEDGDTDDMTAAEIAAEWDGLPEMESA